jgi:hypothetical protein
VLKYVPVHAHTVYRLNRLKITLWIKWGWNHFEMTDTCARVSGFCGVCSNLSHVSSSFYSVSARRFLTVLLSRSDTMDLPLLISFWMTFVFETVFPGNLRQNFHRHVVVEPHFTQDSYRKTRCWPVYRTIDTHNNNRSLIWSWTLLHYCVNNLSAQSCSSCWQAGSRSCALQDKNALFIAKCFIRSSVNLSAYFIFETIQRIEIKFGIGNLTLKVIGRI